MTTWRPAAITSAAAGEWTSRCPLANIKTAQVIEDTLAAGYTTVRDAGGLDAGFKMAVEAGIIKGPRLIISVNIMSPTGGIEDKVSGSGHRKVLLGHDPLSPDGIADGPEGVRAKVRELVRCGADQIKFATTGGASGRPGNGPLDQAYALDEAKALVDEAAALGRSTLCHAVGGTGLPIAIRAGAGSIEHGCYLATDPDMLKMMADQGTFFTPTFEVYDFHSTVSAPHIKVRAQALMDIHIRSTELAIKEGVRIVAGTDAGGFVHGDNARELELMVEKGMSNMLAIQAATGYAAECCGLGKEVGTIAPGKLADILVVDGDPLRNISVLRDRARLLMIMKGGEAHTNRLPVLELQPA